MYHIDDDLECEAAFLTVHSALEQLNIVLDDDLNNWLEEFKSKFPQLQQGQQEETLSTPESTTQ